LHQDEDKASDGVASGPGKRERARIECPNENANLPSFECQTDRSNWNDFESMGKNAHRILFRCPDRGALQTNIGNSTEHLLMMCSLAAHPGDQHEFNQGEKSALM
jgi:hypothetical protein